MSAPGMAKESDRDNYRCVAAIQVCVVRGRAFVQAGWRIRFRESLIVRNIAKYVLTRNN